MSCKIGCHITKKYGILKGLEALNDIGGNACQIQIKNVDVNFIETDTKLDKDDIKNIKKYLNDKKIHLINHSIHKINLARNPYENMSAIKSLANDIIVTDEIGGSGSVFHMGKKLNQSYELSIDNMVKSINIVYDLIKNTNGKILLENSAGEGSALYTIEDMKNIYDKLLPEVQNKLEYVIDTCHSYAAGYDLTTIKKAKEFEELIKNNLGWNKINCIHLNDSYEPLDSHKDRHQNLLLGYLSCNNNNVKGLNYFIKMIKKRNIPIILETNPCLHCAEIQYIKNL